MAMKLYNDTDIQAIADAIRSVNGKQTTYKVREMAAVIRTFSFNPVTSVSLSESSGTLAPNGTVTLVATVLPSNANNKEVIWSSSDTSVATVLNGVVTAIANGSAIITVTTVDGGFTDTYTLTVAQTAVNLVPTAFVPTDHTTIYNNGLGYRDDAYISGTDYGAYSGYCVTGGIDIPTDIVGNINYIYIRGGNITTDSHCRMLVYRYESTSSSFTGRGDAANGWMTGIAWITAIDQLADKYWRLTVDPSWGVAQMGATHRQFRVGVQGLGSELFVSFNDPISDSAYNNFLNS